MSGEQLRTADVRIDRGIISEIDYHLTANKKEKTIDLTNHFLYPGLINSHDHLEMNLYPLLGKPPYKNYTEWANTIYKPHESPIKEIERINISDRLLWGGIKNLLSGATTVVHHNPWHRFLSKEKFPVRVVKEIAWAHSLASERNIQKKFPRRKQIPFVVHAAEGIDDFAKQEITQLHQLELLKENTVLVHAVALNKQNINLIEGAKASVVWCPSSNLFMFGKTSPVDKLKGKVRVMLGSDSTMTGSATLLDEMRTAKSTGLASAKEIFEMVTSVPANVFNLEIPKIEIGAIADLWATPILKNDYFENIFLMKPSQITAVFIKGQLRFGDRSLSELMGDSYAINLNLSEKCIAYDIFSLKKKIEVKTLVKNSLWKILFSE